MPIVTIALRPFAGIVDEVADHFLEVLPLAEESGCPGRPPRGNATVAIAVDLLERPHETSTTGVTSVALPILRGR